MKKFLSIALALLMVCVMLPVVALAAEKTASTYEELKSAISTANDGDTIKLLADIDLSQTYTAWILPMKVPFLIVTVALSCTSTA